MVLPCLVMTAYWQLEQSHHTRDSGPFIQPGRQPQPAGVGLLLLFSHSVVSNSLWLHGLQQARLSCPSPSPGVCANSCPLSQWCHPTISSSITLFCPQSFPAPGLFQWVSSSHQVPKVLELQLQHQSFQWIFRVDFLLFWLVYFILFWLSKVFSNTTV